MPLDALRNSLLEARDCRQALMDGMFPTPFPATVMLSLNLPGTEKTGERAERLFQWGEKALLGVLKTSGVVRGCDDLGPFGIYRTRLPSTQVKRLGISLESMHPAGRLLDLDIYDHAGRPVSRAGLNIAPRTCLICPEPALACIHARRHQSEELMLRARRIIDAL